MDGWMEFVCLVQLPLSSLCASVYVVVREIPFFMNHVATNTLSCAACDVIRSA